MIELAMASFSEFNSTIDYRTNENHHNGGFHQQQEHHYRQQRNGKRLHRKHFERQLSDKHLKRRTQIMQMQSSNSSTTNRRFLSSLHEQQYQYDWQRRSDSGGFFSMYANKKGSTFAMVLLLLLLIVLLAVPTIWYSMVVSTGTMPLSPTRIQQAMPGAAMGGNKHAAHDSDSGDSVDDPDADDNSRSYQDLADSIRRLRKRREALQEESVGESSAERDEGPRKDKRIEHQATNDHGLSNGAVVNAKEEDDDVRLKRMEQRIQRDQNRKVQQELLLANQGSDKDNPTDGRETGDQRIEENASAGNQQQRNGNQQHPDHRSAALAKNSTTLKDKVMSESIAALKLLNDNHNKQAS